MKNIFIYTSIISILFFSTSCRPEDGFCQGEKHTGSKDFICSEMDDLFTEKGANVYHYYTSRVLIYRDSILETEEMLSGTHQTIIEKPEYLPGAIPIEYMTQCTIAPETGGTVCNEWISFTFNSIDNISVKFSSRKNSDFSSELTIKYITLFLPEKILYGTVNGEEIIFEDTAVIEDKNTDIIHRFSLYPK